MTKKGEDSYKFDVIKTFGSRTINPRSKLELRIAVWERNGVPVLEFRRLYQNQHGEWKQHKLAGIDLEAWRIIERHREEITRLLAMPMKEGDTDEENAASAGD